MGWFWADANAAPPHMSHAMPSRSNTQPPPSCPMHNKLGNASIPTPSNDKLSACPIKHDGGSTPAMSLPSSSPTSSATPAQSSTPSYISKLNPLNYMPELVNKREHPEQSISLPLDREASTIPRGQGQGNWEYPSPQQMYNAMLRKGYTDTPAEHVESMVAVHNFLNEGAWDEIRGWEGRFAGGLSRGWELCAKGEEGFERTAALQALRRRRGEEELKDPYLARFEGRPGDMTPKARMLSFMAKVWPSKYPDNPPFDRHDWFVKRQAPGGQEKEVRYVIDYYSGPPEPTGEPVFYLDVRPAVDGPVSAAERLIRWGGDVWWRASGGVVREELARQKR